MNLDYDEIIQKMMQACAAVGKHHATYQQRNVDWFDGGPSFFIDTSAVYDAIQPFETAVKHPRYNDGKLIIVESYNTRDEARLGHQKWVKIMTGPLPDKLVDCANAHIADLMRKLGQGDQLIFPITPEK